MPRPLIVDGYCGQGGAGMGYWRAGFDVLGVDIRPQPRYPFAFVQADVLEFLTSANLASVAAFHVSPPCHDHSSLRSLSGLDGSGHLLADTRAWLAGQGKPWVIENTPGAPMRADLTLCGGMFGLRTYRHRWFEIDPRLPVLLAERSHPAHRVPASTKARESHWDAGWNATVTGHVGSYVGPEAMGIDWMTGDGLSQAIPPAYTEFIGSQLIEAL
jgi:DNA (cytosine-5)-methyltransferase 1